MNDYELRRQEKIKRNQALLAELDIKPVASKPTSTSNGQPSAKKRKLWQETNASAPSRTSARIANAPQKNYAPDIDSKPVPLPRSAKKSDRRTKRTGDLSTSPQEEPEPLVPVKNVEEIQAGWSTWKPSASLPDRDEDRIFHFEDFEDFTPNKSPEEMLREGCFGGSYYRPLRSRKLGVVVEGDWTELPKEWIEGLSVEKFLTSPTYDPDVNKFKVSCGQSIEEWEAAGWIDHENDVRGWFQWYTRFFQGRRCADDERQVSRWKKCVGPTGRWRRMLLKKYVQMGVREVWDDGEDGEETPEVSPVMHQTCHHWAFEVRQGDLDEAWAG